MASKLKKPVIIETAFSPYTLTEILGEGGAGRVYGGFDSEKQPIAAKVLSENKATSDKRSRFKNEIAFLQRNKHQNIVTVIDHGVAKEASVRGPFYVMERYDLNLRQAINEKISPEKVLPLLAGILDGVEAAHLQGAVHRDLKPENILIEAATGSPAVADFGIASFTEDLLATLVETGPSQRLANFRYAAPEQRTPGKYVGASADIYALGLILNEMFTGETALGTEYPRICDNSSDFGFLDDVVAQMIRQDPSKRYGSVADLKAAISLHHSEFLARQKISQIDETVIPEGEIDEPLALTPPKLVQFDWDKGTLTLVLDRPVNAEWVHALNNMSNTSSVMGIPPGVFEFHDNTATVQVQANRVQKVINYFKGWLPNATQTLNESMQKEILAKKYREEQALKEAKEAEKQRLKVLRETEI